MRAKWLRPPRPRFIYTFRTSTEFFNRRSRPVAQKLWNQRICSTVTAPEAYRIRLEKAGSLQPIKKMLRRQNWRNAPRPLSSSRKIGRLEENFVSPRRKSALRYHEAIVGH